MNNRDWRTEAKKAFKERDEVKRKLEEAEHNLEKVSYLLKEAEKTENVRLKTVLEYAFKFPSNETTAYEEPMIFKELSETIGGYLNLKKHKMDGLLDYAIERFRKFIGAPTMLGVMAGLHLGQCFKMREKLEVTDGKEYYEKALETFTFALNELERLNPESKGNDLWKNLMYERGDTLELLGENERSKGCFLELYQTDKSFKNVTKRIGVEQ